MPFAVVSRSDSWPPQEQPSKLLKMAPLELYYERHKPQQCQCVKEKTVPIEGEIAPANARKASDSHPKRVFCLMGFNTEGYAWACQIDHLTRQGYEVVTFDNRGCGRSSAPVGRYTTTLLARDALTLLNDHLKWEPSTVHLLAVSMGGMYGLELVAGLAEGKYSKWQGLAHSKRFLSVSFTVTQAVGWRSYHGLPPLIALAGVMLQSVDPRRSERSKMYKGMEQAFSQSWLRAASGSSHSRTAESLSNGQVLSRRGARVFYAKKDQGFNPVAPAHGVLAQVSAIATHHVSQKRLRQICDTGCPILVVGAMGDLLVKYRQHVALDRSLKPFEFLDLGEGASHGVTDQHAGRLNDAIDRLFSKAEGDGEGQPHPQPSLSSSRPHSRL